MGNELKPLSRPGPPRKTCCALGKINNKSEFKVNTCSLSLSQTVRSTYREGVDQVPAQLLCQKVGDPTSLHNLRELGRVAKRIWKPELKSQRRK